MNEITSWNYEGAEVRTVQIDGEPWFVLADICRELEISHVKDTAMDHQRIRFIHRDSPERQTAGKTVPEMGHIRCVALHPETWCVHDRSGTGKSTDKP